MKDKTQLIPENMAEDGEEKRYTSCTTAGPVFVYVKNGRIIRVEPMHFDKKEVKSWKIEVNGRTYTPPLKYSLLYWGTATTMGLLSQPGKLSFKEGRFSTKGERNPQKCGKSKYIRDLLGGSPGRPGR